MQGKYSVGIDISKKDFKVCFVILDQDQEIQIKSSRKFSNTVKGCESFKKWHKNHQKEDLPIVFVMEATGSYHEHLAWYLYQDKQQLSVVLPNRSKAYMISLGLKSKNDKVDAKGLAMMGAVQKLRVWQPISKQIYNLRALTRHLEDLQKIRTSLMNQQEQPKYAMYELKDVSRSIVSTLKTIDKQIAGCKKKIHAIIAKDVVLKKKVSHITSIKGVSTMTAAVVIGETNGFALINNLKQLTSYAGYDVKENQSGSRTGKTRITKKGNAHIRRAMHLPAFGVVRWHVKSFENLHKRVYGRTGLKMKAYVAVQAKLLRLIYTLWSKETDFDLNYQTSVNQEGTKTLIKQVDKETARSKDPAARDELIAVKTTSPLLVV